MRRWIGLAVTLLVAGCVNPAVEQRKTYLSQFVGQPVDAVVRQFGAPARDTERDGKHFVTYVERRLVEARPVPTFGPPNREGVGGGGSIRLGEMVEGVCETTFEVIAGTVRGYGFRGSACGLAPLQG